MAKDIQIKYINELKEWEYLFPKTKTRIVENDSGEDLDTLLNLKANKNEVYTSLEIDTKLNDINNEIENFKPFDIPVQTGEPDEDYKFWFEII